MESTPLLEELVASETWMRALARRLVNGDDVDDITQDAFIAALQSPPDRDRPIRPWLARVVTNVVRQRHRGDTRRKHREHLSAKGEVLHSTPEGRLEHLEALRALATAVLALPDPIRDTVLLRYYEGLSSVEIACRTKTPEGTVRWRSSEGLRMLRERLAGSREDSRRGLAVLLPLVRERGLAVGTKAARNVPISKFLIAAPVAIFFAVGAMWLSFPPDPPRVRGPVDVEGSNVARHVEADESAAVRSAVAADPLIAKKPMDAAPVVIARMHARFLDQQGQPIVGVTLDHIPLESESLHDADDPAGAAALASARSGATGATVLAIAVEAGCTQAFKARLRATHPDFATVLVESVAVPGEDTWLGTAKLQYAATIVGTVFDSDGARFANVFVQANPIDKFGRNTKTARMAGQLGETLREQVRTDATGAFSMKVPTGFSYVSASETKRNAHWVRSDLLVLRAGEQRRVDLVVERAEWQEGTFLRVVGAEGEPVPLFDVWEFWAIANAVSSRCYSGVDGRVRIPLSESGVFAHDLLFQDRSTSLGEKLLPAGTVVDVRDVIRLDAPESLVVEVVDSEGTPLDPFSLSIQYALSRSLPGWDSDEFPPSEPGRWETRMPTIPFRIWAQAPGYFERVTEDLSPDSLRSPIRITLQPMPGIQGRVTHQGKPVAGARLFLSTKPWGHAEVLGFPVRRIPELRPRRATRTDADGRFTIHDDDAQTLWVHAEAEGLGSAESEPLAFDPEVGIQKIHIELPQPGALEGRVIVPTGEDPSGWIIGLSNGDGFPLTAISCPDGTYRFDAVAPGDWAIRECFERVDPATGAAEWTCATGPLILAPTPTVSIRAGETAVFDLIVRGTDRSALAGTLRFPDLAQPRPWQVRVHRPGAATQFEGTADPDGAFRIDGMPSAEWQVSISDSWSNSLSVDGLVTLLGGENRLDLTVRTGWLSGRVSIGDFEKPVREISISVDQESGLVATARIRIGKNGTFEGALVPAGNAWIKVGDGHDAPAVDLRITPRGLTTVDVPGPGSGDSD